MRRLSWTQKQQLADIIEQHWTVGKRSQLSYGVAALLREMGVSRTAAEDIVGIVAARQGDIEVAERIRRVYSVYRSPSRLAGFGILANDLNERDLADAIYYAVKDL